MLLVHACGSARARIVFFHFCHENTACQIANELSFAKENKVEPPFWDCVVACFATAQGLGFGSASPPRKIQDHYGDSLIKHY